MDKETGVESETHANVSLPSLSEQPKQSEQLVTHARDPYLALRFRDFRLLFLGTFIASVGEQALTVAIGWELYARTGSALALGWVGLVQILPVILLALPAGHLADQYSRRRIVILTQIVLALASCGLAILAFTQGPLLLIYGCLLFIGIAAAFSNPASTSLLPQTIPESVFENAATWGSSSWQMAAVLGPTLGGLMIALFHSTAWVYLFNVVAAIFFVCMVFPIRAGQQSARSLEKRTATTTLHSLVEGLQFLRSTHVILAAITLDLFAVLLGGATTLLPIYARDILHVGPTGYGWLRAAPSLGAVCIGFCITHAPPFRRAGITLLLAVAGFGVATIIFGLSHWFWLSLLMLFALGGLDNVSVVIRSTLLILRTPDRLRGRLAAINSLFTGASNELGGFESGLAAQLFGPVIAVAAGGFGTILVVLLVALLWPEVRKLGSLSE